MISKTKYNKAPNAVIKIKFIKYPNTKINANIASGSEADARKWKTEKVKTLLD